MHLIEKLPLAKLSLYIFVKDGFIPKEIRPSSLNLSCSNLKKKQKTDFYNFLLESSLFLSTECFHDHSLQRRISLPILFYPPPPAGN